MDATERFAAVRQARQFLALSRRGETDGEYLTILAALAPIRPPSFVFPGTPVCLCGRHADPGPATGERVRRAGLVVKARFQHGLVAYVPRKDIGLYAAAYARPFQEDLLGLAVLDVLRAEGPLPRSLIAEMVGATGKVLTASLASLQRAFLVVDEQTETEWDSPWSAVSTEHPEWSEGRPPRQAARAEVLRRFLGAYVIATPREAADWSGFPLREATGLLNDLTERGCAMKADGADGPTYADATAVDERVVPEPSFTTLDPGDPLVSAQTTALKARYPNPVLRWVYQDGFVVGAVEGRWGIYANHISVVNVPDAVGEREDLVRDVLADALSALGQTDLPADLLPFAPKDWTPPKAQGPATATD